MPDSVPSRLALPWLQLIMSTVASSMSFGFPGYRQQCFITGLANIYVLHVTCNLYFCILWFLNVRCWKINLLLLQWYYLYFLVSSIFLTNLKWIQAYRLLQYFHTIMHGYFGLGSIKMYPIMCCKPNVLRIIHGCKRFFTVQWPRGSVTKSNTHFLLFAMLTRLGIWMLWAVMMIRQYVVGTTL